MEQVPPSESFFVVIRVTLVPHHGLVLPLLLAKALVVRLESLLDMNLLVSRFHLSAVCFGSNDRCGILVQVIFEENLHPLELAHDSIAPEWVLLAFNKA
jgi:hypothetical protein